MDEPIARRVCELIAGLLLTDKQFHPAESSFLLRVFTGLGVPADRDAVLTPTISAAEAAESIAELSPEVREATLELLIHAAIIDGKVVPHEQKYLTAVAEAMGIGAEELDARLTKRMLGE